MSLRPRIRRPAPDGRGRREAPREALAPKRRSLLERGGMARSRSSTEARPRSRSAAAASRGRAAPPPEAAPRRRRAPLILRLVRWSLILAVWGSLALGLAVAWFAWDMPSPDRALAATRRPSVTLLAADNRFLASYGDLYGEAASVRDLPAHLLGALLATEDRRFYRHWGLDPRGIARALVANIGAGRIVEGGSTLTQQLAKTLFLSPERSLRRKVQEALMALWLERRYSKDEILSIYLNRVYLGAGAYGIDAAARLYFGVPARALSPWQGAILAGLPKAPSRLNPRADPAAAAARAREVLGNMVEAGMITAPAAARIAAEGARAGPGQSLAMARNTGWFSDWVQDAVSAYARPGTDDVIVRTTLDAALQAVAEARLAALLDGAGARAGAGQGAVVALAADTGAVLAMVGGRDYRASPFNRAVQARRQPGSAFKPIVYLAAAERGLRADDRFVDQPITLGGWSPQNVDGRFRGEVTAREAMARSINTVAVQVLQRAGARNVAEMARRLGIESTLRVEAALALGVSEVTLLELATAYAAIANGGIAVFPHGIAAIADRAGAERFRRRSGGAIRIASAEAIAAVQEMLRAGVANGTGGRAAVPGLAVAGKTGTTQEHRDAWFLGYAGRLVVGVWLGNDAAQPMEAVGGGDLPARLFAEIIGSAPARALAAARGAPAIPAPAPVGTAAPATPAPAAPQAPRLDTPSALGTPAPR
ncbi:MAG: PBP1A family penicillin-binding protein [Alphaproteobacteria bacterium]|nr:PBP1A family penicillin-binding protein [Alphaproteobacteria bacterium]